MHDALYLRIAAEIATLSRCQCRRVGAVLVGFNGVVLAAASNGPGGLDCTGEDGACGCSRAESRALTWAKLTRVVAAVYATHQPCVESAREIVRAGSVQRVRWSLPHGPAEGVEILRAAGIDAEVDRE